jgi:hypothetical protein
MAEDEGPADFAAMLLALEGEVVLPAPRVSRDAMIKILKDHTTLLSDLKSEVNNVSTAVRKLITTADDNKKIIADVLTKVEANKTTMNTIHKTLLEYKIDISEIQGKIECLPEMKDGIQENKIGVDDVSSKLKHFQGQFSEFVVTVGDNISEVTEKTNETDRETKALREYVDHFGDNLTLSSSQIIVESTAGISKKPMSLLDVCSGFNSNFVNNADMLEKHGVAIGAAEEAIDTKADGSLIVEVQAVGEELALIKEHLKREEDQGINAIRRSCEQLTVVIDGIQISLLEKVDRNTTEMIVHQKYEDIVQYLQDALQANAEDEENFKNIARTLQDSVKTIMTSKVDRVDIAPMQEAIANTEAIVFKLKTVMNKEKEQDEMYTKPQVDEFLFSKMDKDDFEFRMAEFMKGKKTKKFSSSANFGESMSRGNSSFVEGEDRTGMQLKLKPMKPSATLPASNSGVNSSTGSLNGQDKFDGSKWAGLGGSYSAGRPMTDGFPVNAPGAFRQNTESNQSGGIPGNTLPSINNMDVTSVQQQKLLQSQSMDGLPAVGYIRDTSFLGAAQMGGGFNTHSKQMLDHPESVSPDIANYPDIEGENM